MSEDNSNQIQKDDVVVSRPNLTAQPQTEAVAPGIKVRTPRSQSKAAKVRTLISELIQSNPDTPTSALKEKAVEMAISNLAMEKYMSRQYVNQYWDQVTDSILKEQPPILS